MYYIFSVLLLCCNLSHAVSLQQAYQAALSNDDLAAVQSQIEQTQERISQVQGGLYPNVNLGAEILRQDDADIFQRGFGQRTQRTMFVRLNQPLFRGFAEFAAIKQSKLLKNQSQLQFEQAKLNLYQSLGGLYYDILLTEKLLTLNQEQERLSIERVSFLEQRVSVGRSRNSELISARAQLMSVKAQTENLKTQLTTQREAFAIITGFSANTKLTEVTDKIDLEPLSSLKDKALQSAWIKSRDIAIDSADRQIEIDKAAHYPSLNFVANYYPQRGGALQDVRWDVGLELSMPIFSGGTDQARVRESLAIKRENILKRNYERRKIVGDITSLYQSITNGQNQYKVLKKNVELNQKNYQELKREYSLGLVTNVDVINALNQYIQSQEQYEELRTKNLKERAQLMSLVGIIK